MTQEPVEVLVAAGMYFCTKCGRQLAGRITETDLHLQKEPTFKVACQNYQCEWVDRIITIHMDRRSYMMGDKGALW